MIPIGYGIKRRVSMLIDKGVRHGKVYTKVNWELEWKVREELKKELMDKLINLPMKDNISM